jgi:hypothetical protein
MPISIPLIFQCNSWNGFLTISLYYGNDCIACINYFHNGCTFNFDQDGYEYSGLYPFEFDSLFNIPSQNSIKGHIQLCYDVFGGTSIKIYTLNGEGDLIECNEWFRFRLISNQLINCNFTLLFKYDQNNEMFFIDDTYNSETYDIKQDISETQFIANEQDISETQFIANEQYISETQFIADEQDINETQFIADEQDINETLVVEQVVEQVVADELVIVSDETLKSISNYIDNIFNNKTTEFITTKPKYISLDELCLPDNILNNNKKLIQDTINDNKNINGNYVISINDNIFNNNFFICNTDFFINNILIPKILEVYKLKCTSNISTLYFDSIDDIHKLKIYTKNYYFSKMTSLLKRLHPEINVKNMNGNICFQFK